MDYRIPQLPLSIDLETKPILKKLTEAHKALAELKGITELIPNQNILLNTLSLQEAKDSSEIENIITTHDELYRSDLLAKQFTTLAAKEVYNYAIALRKGYAKIKETGLLTLPDIIEIQSLIVENNAGLRKLPGTSLKNDQTGETVYTPPQDPNEIVSLMDNLALFINNTDLSSEDPLIKMSIIHHQFETIHPFYDGNGRTGRILNVLYLIKEKLLDTPVLYLSRYINKNKNEYYQLIQDVREHKTWENWVLFMLEGVVQTSYQTILLIKKIKELMQNHKNKIRTELPKIYSQDLLNNLFHHPYTKTDFVVSELNITRKTATKYLEELVQINILHKYKKGKSNYYLNHLLFDLLMNACYKK